MTREDFNIGWKVVYGIVAVVDVIIYFQAKEFWLSYLNFLTFLLVISPLLYLLITENKERFSFYLGVLSCIIICWIFSFGVIFTEEAFNSDAQNYILSSISQGLAALFALVFTVSLIMAQISEKYSNRALEYIFSKKFKIYTILFVFGIIFPLITMKINSEWCLNFSIGIAGTCIILLIPFFLSFKEFTIPGLLLIKSSERATLEMKKSKVRSEQISDIENIIVTALKDKKYPLFEKGLKNIFNIFVEINEMELYPDFQEISIYLFDQTEKDERAQYKVINSLRLAGEDCVTRQLFHANQMICLSLSNIGGKELVEKNERLVKQISWSLMKIGNKSIENGWDTGFRQSISIMKDLFTLAVEQGTENMRYWIIGYVEVLAWKICEKKRNSMLDILIKEVNEVDECLIRNKKTNERKYIIKLFADLTYKPEDLQYDDGIIRIGDALIQLLRKANTWDEAEGISRIMKILIPYAKEKGLKDFTNDYLTALRYIIKNTDNSLLREMIKSILDEN